MIKFPILKIMQNGQLNKNKIKVFSKLKNTEIATIAKIVIIKKASKNIDNIKRMASPQSERIKYFSDFISDFNSP